MNTGHTYIEITCTECDQDTWAEIEFLIGNGKVPRTLVQCKHCDQTLVVTADLTVDVETTTGI